MPGYKDFSETGSAESCWPMTAKAVAVVAALIGLAMLMSETPSDIAPTVQVSPPAALESTAQLR